MFTVEQIKTAHGKVKSGADFPAYINEVKKLGVSFYEYVYDRVTRQYKLPSLADLIAQNTLILPA